MRNIKYVVYDSQINDFFSFSIYYIYLSLESLYFLRSIKMWRFLSSYFDYIFDKRHLIKIEV